MGAKKTAAYSPEQAVCKHLWQTKYRSVPKNTVQKYYEKMYKKRPQNEVFQILLYLLFQIHQINYI